MPLHRTSLDVRSNYWCCTEVAQESDCHLHHVRTWKVNQNEQCSLPVVTDCAVGWTCRHVRLAAAILHFLPCRRVEVKLESQVVLLVSSPTEHQERRQLRSFEPSCRLWSTVGLPLHHHSCHPKFDYSSLLFVDNPNFPILICALTNDQAVFKQDGVQQKATLLWPFLATTSIHHNQPTSERSATH